MLLKKKSSKTYLKKIIICAVWLVIWQIAGMVTGLDFILPGPVNVFNTLIDLILHKSFYVILGMTTIRITIGFVVAFAAGCVIGMIAGFYKCVEEFLAPAVQLMKSLPVTAFIILVLIWFGAQNVSVIISFFVVFPIIYNSFVSGIRNTDRQLVEMAEVFCMNTAKRIRYVYIPQIYPYVLSGLKVTLGMCWKAGISAEVIGLTNNSIGSQMYYSKVYLMTSELFAWSIVVIIVSFLFEKVFLHLIEYIAALLKSA